MRKYFLFILLFFLTIKISALEIIGQWGFNSITNNIGDTLITVNENDFMEIKSDGTFHYELKAKNNLIAKGKWDKTNSLLCFTYDIPLDTTRCYYIKINGDEFTLSIVLTFICPTV